MLASVSPMSSSPGNSDSGEITRHLTECARQGGRAELETLYLRTLPALASWIELRCRTSAAMRVDAGELAQEVWLRVMQNLERYDPALGSFRAWILGIAKVVWLEQCRARRPSDGRRLAGSAEELEQVPDSITSATRALARDECVARFLEHVDALEPVDRMIVIHHGLEGLSCAATGERLDLSAEAVSKRWQRVQVRLRELPIGRDLVAGS